MSRPRHAHESENGRYYTHPQTGQELVSVTNAISTGMSKWGLPLWYARLATEAAWEYLPMMVAALRLPDCEIKNDDESCGRCKPCLTRKIKAAAEDARDYAAELGTRAHDLAEAHVLGRRLPPEPWDETAGLFVDQYLKFLKDFDVSLSDHIVASEMTVANPGLGYAGTLDSLTLLGLDGYIKSQKVATKELPEGKRALWMIDYKTSVTRSSTQTYPEYPLQLAALRHASEMWLPSGEVVPMQRGIVAAGVLNLRPKRYKFIPLPSDVNVFHVFKNLIAQTNWVHNEWEGEYDYRPITPRGTFEPKRVRKPKED